MTYPSSSDHLRVGYGYDIHRLVTGRKLILGGVEFEHERGLDGHSDADVILHAIIDALLGAAGQGDIGQHFPNTDERWRDSSSIVLLAEVAGIIGASGWYLVNVDATLIAEAPKIADRVQDMRNLISNTLGVRQSQVNIKATTAEGTGPEGHKEAMSAQAVALLSRCR